MVSIELAAVEPGVMLAGENEQLRASGRPEQESEIAGLNDPDRSFAVTFKFGECPRSTVTESGAALKDSVPGAWPPQAGA